jgi:hypothetical protein
MSSKTFRPNKEPGDKGIFKSYNEQCYVAWIIRPDGTREKAYFHCDRYWRHRQSAEKWLKEKDEEYHYDSDYESEDDEENQVKVIRKILVEVRNIKNGHA